MPLELTGKIVKINNETSGTSKSGNAWRKVDFMVEYLDGNYTKNAAFSCMGERVETIKRYNVGDTVKVSFNIESREWQDKLFTDLRAWRIEQGQASDNQPSGQTSANTSASSNEVNEATPLPQAEGSDDLPF